MAAKIHLSMVIKEIKAAKLANLTTDGWSSTKFGNNKRSWANHILTSKPST
jgi:hypothetical protein